MGTQEELAKLIYKLAEDGIDLGDFSVSADGVFFRTHRPAEIFAGRYDKELVRVDGWVSGWLAKNKDSK